jgi:hypothetical protein
MTSPRALRALDRALERLRLRGWARLAPLHPLLASQRGQAVVESSVLLATLLGGLVVGGVALNRTHPDMMNAINIQVRGFYYMLSLPFP